jgi:hypothetical protein
MIEWSRVRDVLAYQLTQAPDTGGPNRYTAWLSTANADGSPHVRPLGVVSVAETWYFNSGPGTRKSRNLGRDPHCVLSVATHPFDLVIEGRAERVTDATELQTVAGAFAAQGWPGTGRGRRADRRLQRSVGGAATVARVQDRAGDGVRVRHCRALRRSPLRPRNDSMTAMTKSAARIPALIERWADAVHTSA